MPKKIDEAILAFQSGHKLTKENFNPFHKNYYLSLGSLMDGIHNHFLPLGIIVRQSFRVQDSFMICVSEMVDTETGDKVGNESCISVPAGSSAQQSAGCMTYARRYGLLALLGVEADDDDDGNIASGNIPKQQAAPKPVAQKPVQQAEPRSEDARLNGIIDQSFDMIGVPKADRAQQYKAIAFNVGTKNKVAGQLADMAASGAKWNGSTIGGGQ